MAPTTLCIKWLTKQTSGDVYLAGTFHSVGCQIVRRNVAQLGDTGRQPFAIFDQDDTKNVMKLALKKHFSLKRGTAAVTAAPTEEAEELDEEADGASAEQAPLHDWVRSLTASLTLAGVPCFQAGCQGVVISTVVRF